MSNVSGLGNQNLVIADGPKKLESKSQEVKISNEGNALKSCDKISVKEYIVKKGDNLWNISKQEYNTPMKWPNIFEANKDKIKDPNLIYPDQVLKIPHCDTTPEPPQNSEPTPIDNTPVDNTPTVPPIQEHPPIANPTPTPPKPDTPPVAVEPKPKKDYTLGKVAVASGVAGAAVTGLTFVAITASLKAPLSNLGGYATAQIVAKNVNKVGLSLPTGPALTKAVSKMGGPKSTGTMVALGVGVAVAGAAVGSYYLYNKMKN